MSTLRPDIAIIDVPLLAQLPPELRATILTDLQFSGLKVLRFLNRKHCDALAPYLFHTLIYHLTESSYLRALHIGRSTHLHHHTKTIVIHKDFVESIRIQKRIHKFSLGRQLDDAGRYNISTRPSIKTSKLKEDLKELLGLFPNLAGLRIANGIRQSLLGVFLLKYSSLERSNLSKTHFISDAHADEDIHLAFMMAYGNANIADDQIKHLQIDFSSNEQIERFFRPLRPIARASIKDFGAMRSRFKFLNSFSVNIAVTYTDEKSRIERIEKWDGRVRRLVSEVAPDLKTINFEFYRPLVHPIHCDWRESISTFIGRIIRQTIAEQNALTEDYFSWSDSE